MIIRQISISTTRVLAHTIVGWFKREPMTEDFPFISVGAVMNRITEIVSIKPKRGRPYLLFNDAKDKREWIDLNDDVRSERTAINRVYHDHALQVLGGGHKPEFLWLADAKANRFKRSILTELGRVDDDEEMCVLAGYICEEKMRTSEAVSFIRDCRGVLKPASAERLEKALYSTIERWLEGNGTREQAVGVLRTLTTDFEGSTQPVPATATSASGSTPQSPR
jgi:hypothetical protein